MLKHRVLPALFTAATLVTVLYTFGAPEVTGG